MMLINAPAHSRLTLFDDDAFEPFVLACFNATLGLLFDEAETFLDFKMPLGFGRFDRTLACGLAFEVTLMGRAGRPLGRRGEDIKPSNIGPSDSESELERELNSDDSPSSIS